MNATGGGASPVPVQWGAMAEYTRYSVEPEDIPRRRRERKKKAAKSRSRAWLIVKLFIVALLLASSPASR